MKKLIFIIIPLIAFGFLLAVFYIPGSQETTSASDPDNPGDPSVTDSFTTTNMVASNTNLIVDTTAGQVKLTEVSFTCGGTLTDSRDGKTYATVLIGTQCWMKQGLNVGTRIAGATNQGTSCASIQKYCYDDTDANCDLNNNPNYPDGALYQWKQAVCGAIYPDTEGVQGICPTGWHLPTDAEYKTLEMYLGMTQAQADAEGWRGTDQGTKLKPGGTSGFEGNLAGYVASDVPPYEMDTGGGFMDRTAGGDFWSSSQCLETMALGRDLYSSRATVDRWGYFKGSSASVRCIKDVPFACGNSVTFTYKGSSVTYGTVSSAGGRCWLDRNLGASSTATAYNDANAYGDLFQWGRLDDGHQTRTSGKTAILSSSNNPGHSNFIYVTNIPYDWRSPQNPNLWQGVSGINNPCPGGWRLPTKAEWVTEEDSWSADSRYGAIASPLKLPCAGSRDVTDGAVYAGSDGYYWMSTPYDTEAWRLWFASTDESIAGNWRGYGESVRCIKD